MIPFLGLDCGLGVNIQFKTKFPSLSLQCILVENDSGNLRKCSLCTIHLLGWQLKYLS